MTLKTLLIGSAMLVAATTDLASGQAASVRLAGPSADQLFVGACYPPVDRSPQEIRNDIALMKQAGGGYYGAKGRSRMWTFFGLLNGGQGMLAWTFNSHRGGRNKPSSA